jgi:hypothetical protein
MKKLTGILATVFLALATVGCDLETLAEAGRVTEEFQESHPFAPGGSLYLKNFNGSVEILGWEKPEILITGTKHASSDEALKALRVDIAVRGNTARIQSLKPSGWPGGLGVRYVVRVPHETAVEEVESSNGSVRMEDLKGPKKVRTSNGSVRLRTSEGDLTARTTNGKIEAYDLRGMAQLQTSNGSIQLERFSGSADASTSNGGIRIEVVDSQTASPFRLQTSNGSVNLRFDGYHSNAVRVRTTNGSITVELPQDANARVRAESARGRVESNLTMARSFVQEKGRLEGELGSGGGLIELETSNSRINLMRR